MSGLVGSNDNRKTASDPDASAWVVANAGSGKTHALTQRVIRLLLSGADPAAILCLTFTKVAAAEMARRIFGRLGKWTTLPETELRAEIEELQGGPPSAVQLAAARRLFARALETPGGLKIQTVHAFCERLLHQFPFEANVPGQFAILDDTAAAALIAGARAEVMAEAAGAPYGRLAGAMRHLAEHASDADIERTLDCVVAKREAIRRWIEQSAGEGGAGSIDDALADLRGRLGLKPGETEATICHEICRAEGWSHAHCRDVAATIAEALSLTAHQTNARAHTKLSAIFSSSEPFGEAAARLAFFLQVEKDGGWRAFEASHRFKSHRFGADFGRANEDLLERFEAESMRLLGYAEKIRAITNFAATEALLVVGDAILQHYHAAKRRAGYLDFGDLIVKARNLLSRADAAQWVLYKLDARIEHILVDEAQDTSPDQWAVVQAIAGDFFAGATAARGRRTIFAVGDDKQSIFGFQGAAPHMLADMERFFQHAAEAAALPFVRQPLALSFRSTTEVLDAVDHVLSPDLREKVTASGYETHTAKRLGEPGAVVVLPRIVRRKAAEPEDWTAPFDEPTGAESALAKQIAEEIARLVGTRLPSGKRVRPGEILILVRSRGAFVTAINRALRAGGIRAAGADRIPVATHIAVLDLLALADVVLLPEDDLQLAACLKSPLFGIDEDELLRLARGRGRASLWSALWSSTETRMQAAMEKLAGWRSMADLVSPFRFFATVLGPDGGRRAFRERLGGEADDVLDAFLSQALNYENIEPPSLQGFLRFIRASRNDIKREAEEASSGVRVMTVHGAKGLEADVVFLVDTGSQIVHGSHREILVDIGTGRDDPAFLWRRPGQDATDRQKAADAVQDEETRREYLRLLYVAMTRARDVLYVCGIRGEKKEVEGCWYSLVANALVPQGTDRDADSGELVARYEWPQPPRAPIRAAEQPEQPSRPTEAAPAWLFQPAPSPSPAPRPLRPSRALAEPDPRPDQASAPDAPPMERGVDRALLRGRLVHRLLQVLPGLPAEARPATMERLIVGEIPGDPALAKAIQAEAGAVLLHPELQDMFGPRSRAEVPIVGHVAAASGAHAVSGQIDRMARTPDGWRIVDFKTDRHVPDRLEDANPAYVLQLALYRRLLMEMEPGVPVSAALVWTAAPNIVPIPEASMEDALAKLGIRAMAVP